MIIKVVSCIFFFQPFEETKNDFIAYLIISINYLIELCINYDLVNS